MSDTANLPTTLNPDSDYPSLVASWIGETIPELEASIFDGTLAELIDRPDIQEAIGPHLSERYQTIAREKLKHDPAFRRNWIQRFIEVFQDLLQPARKIFPAKAAINPKQMRMWSANDPMPPSILVNHYHGDVTLRPDQVLSVRGWGNWFSFDDEELDCFYTNFLVNEARKDLALSIKNLWNIEATYLSGFSNLSAEVTWNPESRGGLFEHLMLDVLNEFEIIAHRAPLAEDILEQTDLRVKFPAVARKLGSRVQVALTANPELHERKVNALYLPGEFIILSPLELASCAVQTPTMPQFEMLSGQNFWAPLGGRCEDETQLAHQLRALFLDTFSLPTTHPLGPMWILPPSLRQFIRAFSKNRAMETTRSVRERLEKSRRRLDSVGKFTSPYWKAKFSQAPAKEPGRAVVDAVPEQPSIKQVMDVKKASKPASPPPEKSEISASPPIPVSASVAGWKIQVRYTKNGKQHSKNLGRTLVEHGDPADWAIAGPIHRWLKDQLVSSEISFSGIESIVAGRKEILEQVDHLLEHLPLTEEEIESCH